MRPFEQAPRRRDIRYPVRLPVIVRLAAAEIAARSENLSLAGILLSSDSLIPEGSTVDLAVEVGRMSERDVFLTARGTVLRVQPHTSGKFAVAVACDHPFRITQANPGTVPKGNS
jgi:hypothetical protein